MSTFSIDAGSIAELWRLNPEQNAAYPPPKLSGQTITNSTESDDSSDSIMSSTSNLTGCLYSTAAGD